MTLPRLVATDLDGTIVRGDGTISPRTVAAFERAERAGARFVLVTGRPPRLMAGIAAVFGHRGVAICSNGALTYDMGTGGITGERLIPAGVLSEAARLLRRAIPGIGIAVENAFELTADDRYQAGVWDEDLDIPRLDDAKLLGRPAAKLLGRHPDFSADDLLALARPAIGGIVNTYHSNGRSLVEAVAAGVSKASAVAALATEYGLTSADVIAFGDMPNDLPMLAWAGRSYGMANAHRDVLAAVDHVIGGIDEDGVAAVLEGLFP